MLFLWHERRQTLYWAPMIATPPAFANSAAAPVVRHWPLVAAATVMLLVTMGIRQSLGLFVQPLARDTGLGIQTISFALAVGQFVWGAVQPAFGALADSKGSGRVLVAGGVLLAVGMALTPFFVSGIGLLLTLGVVAAAGAGAGSFSILIGSMARRLPAERRSMAAGVINAGGSFGQFLFAPFVQAVMSFAGWAVAAWALAVAALTTLPLAWPLRRRTASGDALASAAAPSDGMTLRRARTPARQH